MVGDLETVSVALRATESSVKRQSRGIDHPKVGTMHRPAENQWATVGEGVRPAEAARVFAALRSR